MNQERVLLSVKSTRQRNSECAIAAATTMARFYDKDITYKEVRKLVPRSIIKKQEGMWTSQEARILNKLGFSKVTIVTADLDTFDFSWSYLSKEKMIEKLKQVEKQCLKNNNIDNKKYTHDIIVWLSDPECDNQIIIDQDFSKYIRRSLQQGGPVGASVNWTSLHRFKKQRVRKSVPGDIEGDSEYHAIVIRGYDDSDIFVVDSLTSIYKGQLKKFKNGYYKISWEKFLVNAPTGDLILID